MIVMLNEKGKRMELPRNDFLHNFLTIKRKLDLFCIKVGRKIIVIKNRKKVGEIIFPTTTIPRKAYDLEVSGR